MESRFKKGQIVRNIEEITATTWRLAKRRRPVDREETTFPIGSLFKIFDYCVRVHFCRQGWSPELFKLQVVDGEEILLAEIEAEILEPASDSAAQTLYGDRST